MSLSQGFLAKAYMYIMHHANVYTFLVSLVSKIGRSKGKYCEWQWQLKKNTCFNQLSLRKLRKIKEYC